MATKKRGLVAVVGGVFLAGLAGGAWWALQPEPEPAPGDVAEAAEADPSRDETEDLMRQIGYVQ